MRARATLIGSLAIALSVPLLAQPIPPASIADKEMGWLKVYAFKAESEPLKVDTRVYTAAQRTIAVDLANWMQASYSPIGGLGDVVRTFPGTGPAVPQSYGVIGKIYTELKYGPNRKLDLYTSANLSWNVMVNGSFGEGAMALSTPEHYYFTIPTFAEQGFGEDLEKAVDLSGHPFLRQFPGWFQRNSVNGNRKFVLLSKDARLPFVKLTRGEYLDAVGVAITRTYDADKKRITEAEQGDQERITRFMKYYEERTAKRREVLEANRAKYRNRLQEVAEIWTTQPDIMLENFPDVFEGYGATVNMTKRLPVYTVDAATLERCRSGPPQWIVVSWTGQLNDPANKHLHDAVVNQFNIEYIYNRYFDPEKVKGLPYTPLRPASTETVAADPSAASKTLAADPSVYFFEDFSGTVVGKKPLNWHSTLNNAGASSVVMELKGLEGHWASISGFELTPTGMKTPLPRDFEVSYDVVAAQNYTWGAHGMNFKLSRKPAAGTGESFLSLRIRPGFSGKEGSVEIEGQFPGTQGYLDGTGVGAPGFSNDAVNNRVTVTLRKKGELLQVFIGKTKVAEYEKAIPPGLQFDAMSFQLGGVSANDRMFISNIRIATI
jgi:hypothetical protein